jgi:hypothetical protein
MQMKSLYIYIYIYITQVCKEAGVIHVGDLELGLELCHHRRQVNKDGRLSL